MELGETKRALIHAAGELFAERGLDGTSIRAIAEKAGANIASINYHFGSKEHLYTETLRHIILDSAGMSPSTFIKEKGMPETPEAVASTIHHIVLDKFKSYFSPDRPQWHGLLVMRSFLSPSPSLQVVVKQVFEPDHETLKSIIQLAKPGILERKARLWAFSIVGQIAFYAFAKIPILMILNKDDYDEDFMNDAAEHVATSAIEALGLSRPEAGV